MKITKRQLRRIIKEEKLKLMEATNQWGNESPVPDDRSSAAQMSTPAQRDPGTGTPADAARLLGGILDDWANDPDMSSNIADTYFDRIEDVTITLSEL